EEERAVANDRTTQREAVLVLLEVADVVLAAHEVLVASVAVDRAEEIVLAALRHGVDEDAGEVALAHVVRRQQYLVLLDRLDADGLSACLSTRLSGGAESEEVRLGGAVDLDVVEAVVRACTGEARARTAHLRREGHEVREVAVQRRKTADERVAHCRCRSAALRRDELLLAFRGDRHLGELCRGRLQHEVDRGVLAELYANVLDGGGCVPDATGSHHVLRTDLESENGKAAVLTRAGSGNPARGRIAHL